VGCNVGGLTQASNKAEDNRPTQARHQVIWGNLPQGPMDNAVKDFSKRLKACVGAGGGHFEHLQ